MVEYYNKDLQNNYRNVGNDDYDNDQIENTEDWVSEDNIIICDYL